MTRYGFAGAAWRHAHLTVCAVTLAALAFAGCGAPSTIPRGTGPRADLPSYKIGDRWLRNDHVLDLIRIEPDAYVFSAAAGEEVWLTKDLMLLRYSYNTTIGAGMTRPAVAWQFTPPPRLDWPLEVGKSGKAKGTVTVPYGDEGRAELAWAVKSYEDVTVAAGTFKAFRVDFAVRRTGLVSSPGRYEWVPFPGIYRNVGAGGSWQWVSTGPARTSAWSYTMWYAPNVRQWVKAQGSIWQLEFDVIAVEPEEGEPLKIALQKPADQADMSWEEIRAGLRVTGIVTTGKGLRRVAVDVNGETVFSEKSNGKKADRLDVSLPLRGIRDGKNIVIVSATDQSGATAEEARTIDVRLPLSLDFSTLGDKVRLSGDSVLLTGRVAAGDAIERLGISVNRVEQFLMSAEGKREVTFEASLQLTEGENLLRVSMTKVNGDVATEDRIIIVDRSAPVAATLPPAPAPPAPAAATQLREEPVRLEISTPGDRERVTEGRVRLTGRVAADKGVANVSITLNGVEVFEHSFARPARAFGVNVVLDLARGTNEVVVTAKDASGASQNVRRLVEFR